MLNLGLFVINTGFTAICVRPQGQSVVDLCIGNMCVQRMLYKIEVLKETVTISDHRLINIELIRQSEHQIS